MNQYVIYTAMALGIIVLALLIPGVKVIAELLIKGVLTAVGIILKHKGTFFIWFLKTLSSDHSRIFKHAITSRDEVDPTQKIRRKAEGYES